MCNIMCPWPHNNKCDATLRYVWTGNLILYTKIKQSSLQKRTLQKADNLREADRKPRPIDITVKLVH